MLSSARVCVDDSQSPCIGRLSRFGKKTVGHARAGRGSSSLLPLGVRRLPLQGGRWARLGLASVAVGGGVGGGCSAPSGDFLVRDTRLWDYFFLGGGEGHQRSRLCVGLTDQRKDASLRSKAELMTGVSRKALTEIQSARGQEQCQSPGEDSLTPWGGAGVGGGAPL